MEKYRNSSKLIGPEILRFVFCLIVLLHHATNSLSGGETSEVFGVKAGGVAVDFFFLLSGIFMAKKILPIADDAASYEKIGIDGWKFIKGKYCSVWPTHLLVFIIMFVERALFNSWGFKENVSMLLHSIPEAFLIQMSGLEFARINPNDWYLSAMLLAMMILFPLLRKYGHMFSRIIAPIFSLSLLSYLYHSQNNNSFSGEVLLGGFAFRGLIRGVATVSLGLFLYELAEFIGELKISERLVFLLRILEVTCYATTVVGTFFIQNVKDHYSFILVVCIGLIVTFSRYSVFLLLPRVPIIFYLGELSLTIYLCQRIIMMIMEKYSPTRSYYTNTLILVFGSIALSVVIKGFIEWCRRLWKTH